ncbi:hypothetical protein [Streptomyces sp. bgisy153]|uniref:hypothetical protein n=1 Tax=Streptomyces sp. bgisy153 TaxID=3413793 RepID=UPI003D734C72
MSELFTAGDLRALADAVELLNGTTQKTGVVISGWGDGEIRVRDVVIRLQWRKDDEAASGEYVVEFPDQT